MKLTSIVLFLIMLLQAGNSALSVILFELNRSYIANTLCVNRGSIHNCCKGKCYLRKQLESQNSASSVPTNTYKAKYFEENLFFNPFPKVVLPFVVMISNGIRLCQDRKSVV